ncbi:dihydrofolate reductase [Arsenicitalea aurantiaca]|uniref:Dihydrofolate reductase n=1 Tax=Arsenicitalea aurantiaca TaxID=1783274 RepID=A0A433XG47_9HYPH|nr:dihydrofolate reductase family protein [Arsenicitalea aurantiaca]RUT33063.1 dihydrofolate reductase [Arsenicitalea aurantiaca]
MARIVGYIAQSLDGFIATERGTLEWLLKYDDLDQGEFSYERFIARIATIVMGRDTYEYVANEMGADWPYPDQRSIVVTSRPIENLPTGVEVWSEGVDALIAHLRADTDGDVWMVGGGRLQMAFLERGALDEIEIYVMAELIGGGVPIFPPTGFVASPRLISATTLNRGCVRLHYAFDTKA